MLLMVEKFFVKIGEKGGRYQNSILISSSSVDPSSSFNYSSHSDLNDFGKKTLSGCFNAVFLKLRLY